MIENDIGEATARNFGITLRNGGDMFFVPTDGDTKTAMAEVLQATYDALNGIDGDWEAFDISEDYGSARKLYAQRDADYSGDISDLYDIGALADIANLDEHASEIDYYFCEFYDDQDRKIVGIKKAAQFKTTLAARNKLIRIVDDTLQLIDDNVLKIDPVFDALITDDHIYILKPRPFEYLANIVAHVANAATDKVAYIHDNIAFLHMERIKGKIGQHPKMARLAASIASRDDLGTFQRAPIEALAEQHGIKFKEVDGRLQCRVADETKLLEILDARRYHLDLTTNGGVPYRASARQRV